MPSILVVEHEGRYIERIQHALSSEGWRPRFVAGRPEALRSAASEAPNLVLVNAELPGAQELLRAFARLHGGPGSVALVGERNRAESLGADADELLAKPFSDQELRLVVRRRLAAAEQPAPGAAATALPAGGGDDHDDDHKLTSQEIFGDLLAEVEGEASPSRAAGRAVAAAPAEPRPAAGPGAAGARPRDLDEDVELRLERTLSGVPGLSSRRAAGTARATEAATAAPRQPPPDQPDRPPSEAPPRQPPPSEAPPREPPPPLPPEPPRRDPEPDRPPQGDPPPARRTSRSLRPDSDDVDELLNMTLSGLDLGGRVGRRSAPAVGPAVAAAPGSQRPARSRSSEIDLELEALVGLGRRRSARPGEDSPGATRPPAAAAPSDAAPADAPPAAPGAPAPATLPPLGVEPPATAPGSGVAESGPGDLERAADPGAPGAGAAVAAESAPGDTAGSAPAPPDALAEPVPAAATPSAPGLPAPSEGRRFGHYTLLDRIAVGGMAEVWKARMSGVEGFQKTVAIKRILPHMNDDSEFVDMFIDEAKLAAQLNHPNITHIYDLGKIGDDFYIAMEYVDGRNLRAILNESRRKALPLPVGFGLVVAARLASALEHAHRKRDFDDRQLELVHRDVSPQNVLISTDGDIKLCDFGISKAVAKVSQTETGALKGKLQYMSPEQAWGRAVDGRSDIFSLGALGFEMLTGERLFTGDSEISVLEAVRECRVRGPRQVNPAVPAGADAVVLKALAREPENRFQTAGEMQQALEEILYQLRPTPSQADVAAFLVRLEEAPEVKPGSRGEAPHTGSRRGAAAGGGATGAGPVPAGEWVSPASAGSAAAGNGSSDTASGTGVSGTGISGAGVSGTGVSGTGVSAAEMTGTGVSGTRVSGTGVTGTGVSGTGSGGSGARGAGAGGTGVGGIAAGSATAGGDRHRRQAEEGTASGGAERAAGLHGRAAGGSPSGTTRRPALTVDGEPPRPAENDDGPLAASPPGGRSREGRAGRATGDDRAGAAEATAAEATATGTGPPAVTPARRWWPFGAGRGAKRPAPAAAVDGGGGGGDDAGEAELETAAGSGSTTAIPRSAAAGGVATAGVTAVEDPPAAAGPPAVSALRRGGVVTAGGFTPAAAGSPAGGAAGALGTGGGAGSAAPPSSSSLARSGATRAADRPRPGAPSAAESTDGGGAASPSADATAAGRQTSDQKSRRRWLIAAILLVATAAALLAWLLLWPPGAAPETVPAVSAETSPEAAPAPVGETAETPAESDESAVGPDLERLVDERLAETEQALRAQAEAEYQERARRIQEQIEALNRASRQPEAP